MSKADDSWMKFHAKIYNQILASLRERPPASDLKGFILNDVPTRFGAAMGEPYGYTSSPPNILTYGPVKDGDPVRYWTGSELEERPFETSHYMVGDYLSMADKMIDLAARFSSPVILDIGAGTCLFATALRAKGCMHRIINLDVFDSALQIGRAIVDRFGLADVGFGNVDIGYAAKNDGVRKSTTEILSAAIQGHPLIIISRFAVFPFYHPDDYGSLFDFLFHDLKAVAGMHLEMCGSKTPSYAAISRALGIEATIANKLKDQPEDPLAFVQNNHPVGTVERIEVWPHFLTTRFPSYLSWVRI